MRASFAVEQALDRIPAALSSLLYFIIAQLVSFLLDFFFNRGRIDRRKDLKILLLRQ